MRRPAAFVSSRLLNQARPSRCRERISICRTSGREWLRHLLAWAMGAGLLGIEVLVVGDLDRNGRC